MTNIWDRYVKCTVVSTINSDRFPTYIIQTYIGQELWNLFFSFPQQMSFSFKTRSSMIIPIIALKNTPENRLTIWHTQQNATQIVAHNFPLISFIFLLQNSPKSLRKRFVRILDYIPHVLAFRNWKLSSNWLRQSDLKLIVRTFSTAKHVRNYENAR